MLENISKLIYLRVSKMSKMIFSDYRRIWPWASRVYHKVMDMESAYRVVFCEHLAL
jgi:hypothetical protein